MKFPATTLVLLVSNIATVTGESLRGSNKNSRELYPDWCQYVSNEAQPYVTACGGDAGSNDWCKYIQKDFKKYVPLCDSDNQGQLYADWCQYVPEEAQQYVMACGGDAINYDWSYDWCQHANLVSDTTIWFCTILSAWGRSAHRAHNSNVQTCGSIHLAAVIGPCHRRIFPGIGKLSTK